MDASFKKILTRFRKQYGRDGGTTRFYKWLNKNKLDDTKPYSSQRENDQDFDEFLMHHDELDRDEDSEYDIESKYSSHDRWLREISNSINYWSKLRSEVQKSRINVFNTYNDPDDGE